MLWQPGHQQAGAADHPQPGPLASQGIRFTQGYVAYPICSPSRTAVLTGIEPARYAIYSFLNDKANNAARNMVDWVQPATVTAPRLFKQAGYVTGQFGKWHMGNGRDVNNAPPPSAYGFDESLVAFEGNGNRLLYWNDDGSKYSLSQANEDATVGTYQYVYSYEAAGKHTDAALAFITNAVNAGKPFYVHVPYNDTHSPYNVPPGQENDFDHITTDTDAKLFLGELHNLDKQIGRLMSAVDGLGISNNTLMVVVGDNGAPNDTVKTLLNRNGGLRSGKGNLYEGGIREPFLIRWPGTVPAGVVNSNTVVSTLDLLPTYCALAGIRAAQRAVRRRGHERRVPRRHPVPGASVALGIRNRLRALARVSQTRHPRRPIQVHARSGWVAARAVSHPAGPRRGQQPGGPAGVCQRGHQPRSPTDDLVRPNRAGQCRSEPTPAPQPTSPAW